MDELLAVLRTFDALRDTHGDGEERADTLLTRTLPSQPPDLAPADHLDRLPPPMREALAAQGVQALYAHQAEAIDRIRAGEDVVLEAPTASDKTLCFNIPLVLALLDARKSHALMVHPMKALSNDQRRQLQELAGPLEAAAKRRLESWIFDGDLEPEHRKLVKAHPPAVLFTNPEMLHQSFLGWHEQWLKFLSGLKLVILDEIREYLGYFGTNVALLLRRFLARLAQLDVRPQVVLATATCGNAQEHAYRLTGRRCTLVRAVTAMRPERHFAFINPAILASYTLDDASYTPPAKRPTCPGLLPQRHRARSHRTPRWPTRVTSRHPIPMVRSTVDPMLPLLILATCAHAAPPEPDVYPRQMPESAVQMFESTVPDDPDRTAGWRFYLDQDGCYFVTRNKAYLFVDVSRLQDDDPALFWNTPFPAQPAACLSEDAVARIQGLVEALDPDDLPAVTSPDQPASDAEMVRWTFRRPTGPRSLIVVDPDAWRGASLLDRLHRWYRLGKDLAALYEQSRREVEMAEQQAG